jgi:hypothetical protein
MDPERGLLAAKSLKWLVVSDGVEVGVVGWGGEEPAAGWGF